MRRIFLISSIVLILASLMVGCYMLPTARPKWRIKLDEAAQLRKEKFLNEPASNKPDAPRPNIVYILVDDLGKYDITAYGDGYVHTPHINSIGERGALFTEGYVSAPICSPSRAGLMTGRYQQRFGYYVQPAEFYPKTLPQYLFGRYLKRTGNWVMKTKPAYPNKRQVKNQGLPPSEITLAELLKKHGYKTGMIGKWHLGHHKDFIPNKRGFDYQYGFYSAYSLYAQKDDPNVVHHVNKEFSEKYIWRQGRKGSRAIRQNDTIVYDDHYLTFKLKDEAINFMERSKDEPFFLYLGFNAPHTPFQAPQSYYDKFDHVKDVNKRVYYAMIAALDDAVGDVLKGLKDLGIEENTIVYFVSDNGGATYTQATDNGPLKGGKITDFEGGINVPFMMMWPGKIPAGTIYERPVITLDLFATAAELAGCYLPQDRVYDGVNLMPYLTGEQQGDPHEALYWKAFYIHAMRKGDWKFILSTRDKWAFLYNLKEDKFEKINLKDQKPDILNDMMHDFAHWELHAQPPLWPNLMDYKFVIAGKKIFFPA